VKRTVGERRTMKRAHEATGASPINEELYQCPVCLEVVFGKIVTCPEGSSSNLLVNLLII